MMHDRKELQQQNRQSLANFGHTFSIRITAERAAGCVEQRRLEGDVTPPLQVELAGIAHAYGFRTGLDASISNSDMGATVASVVPRSRYDGEEG
jgi:hypothetical protein